MRCSVCLRRPKSVEQFGGWSDCSGSSHRSSLLRRRRRRRWQMRQTTRHLHRPSLADARHVRGELSAAGYPSVMSADGRQRLAAWVLVAVGYHRSEFTQHVTRSRPDHAECGGIRYYCKLKNNLRRLRQTSRVEKTMKEFACGSHSPTFPIDPN